MKCIDCPFTLPCMSGLFDDSEYVKHNTKWLIYYCTTCDRLYLQNYNKNALIERYAFKCERACRSGMFDWCRRTSQCYSCEPIRYLPDGVVTVDLDGV